MCAKTMYSQPLFQGDQNKWHKVQIFNILSNTILKQHNINNI